MGTLFTNCEYKVLFTDEGASYLAFPSHPGRSSTQNHSLQLKLAT